MKLAIHFHRAGSAFSRESVGPTRHSQRTAQRLLSKKMPQARPENSSGDGKRQKPDSSSFSEAIRLAQQGDAAAFEIIYQQHSARVYALACACFATQFRPRIWLRKCSYSYSGRFIPIVANPRFRPGCIVLTANLVLMHLRRKETDFYITR